MHGRHSLLFFQCLYSTFSSEICDLYVWRKPRYNSDQRKSKPFVTMAVPHTDTAGRFRNVLVESQYPTNWSDCQDIFLLLPSFFLNHVFKCLQCLRANKEELHIWLRKCHWHVAYHLQPFSSLSVSDHIYLFLAQGINLMFSDKMMAFLLNCVKHLSMFVMKIQWTFSENDLTKWQQCPARAS